MSEGLYSMEAKDFDKTLDFTKIKPYGDTMNDGVFSSWNGHKPLKFAPLRRKLTKSPTTSTISAESRILSTVSLSIMSTKVLYFLLNTTKN